MSTVTRIKVQNVRVHNTYDLAVSPSTTVVTGANGSGKTSMIEALYIALQGSSFKGGDTDVLRVGASWYRIDVGLGGGMRTVKFDPSRPTGKKKFEIEGTSHYRLPPKYKYPVVLFEPDDLRLLHGSPARRRDYFDRFIAQLDPHFGVALRKYERALRQRNALLKKASVSSDDLFVWDVSLSEHGTYIVKQRAWYVGLLQAKLGEVYKKIAGVDDEVGVEYPGASLTRQHFLSLLHSNAKKDMITGFTSVGPHRHDILFTYNQSPALSVASRGEVRSTLLALKFIEVEILEQLFQVKPIILLDDVFSELDEQRQANLMTKFRDHQIIITSTTAVQIEGAEIIEVTARAKDQSHQ